MLDPTPGALLPANAASPLFRWKGTGAPAYLLRLFVSGSPMGAVFTDEPRWEPGPEAWTRLAAASLGAGAAVEVEILALGGFT
ncbi:MAG: hypothetical protein AB7D51_13790, partial [Desulfovibrionaceae bacterium]